MSIIPQKTEDTLLEEVFGTGPQSITVEPGKVIPGRVIAIDRGRVIVDLGGTTTGIVSGKELTDAFHSSPHATQSRFKHLSCLAYVNETLLSLQKFQIL